MFFESFARPLNLSASFRSRRARRLPPFRRARHYADFSDLCVQRKQQALPLTASSPSLLVLVLALCVLLLCP
jgi:hypothetical protein